MRGGNNRADNRRTRGTTNGKKVGFDGVLLMILEKLKEDNYCVFGDTKINEEQTTFCGLACLIEKNVYCLKIAFPGKRKLFSYYINGKLQVMTKKVHKIIRLGFTHDVKNGVEVKWG